MNMERSAALKSYVIARFSKRNSNDSAHQIDHFLRVYKVGVAIGRRELANLEILKPALLLHDSIRPNALKGEKDHAHASALFAANLLTKFGYTQQEIARISDAILSHSRSDKAHLSKTLEAKILYDADKQDGFGKVGVLRAKQLCKNRGYSNQETAEWYLFRILDVIKNEPPYTKYGRKIVKKKLPYSLNFCKKTLGRRYNVLVADYMGKRKISF